MPATSQRVMFNENDLELLERIHKAIKDDPQNDVIAKLQEEVAGNLQKSRACVVAFRDALESVGKTCEGLDYVLLELDEKEQSTGKGRRGSKRCQDKKDFDRHLERIAYISMVWSPEVVRYYGWDVDHGYGKIAKLYSCAKAYGNFEDFQAHHNLLQWLRHCHGVARMVSKQNLRNVKLCAGTKDLDNEDLDTLKKLKTGGSVMRYGQRITPSSAEEHRHRMDEWTQNRDGAIEVNGLRVDLKESMGENWEVYLLQYDRHGRLKQRERSDLAKATPPRHGIISPPASSMAMTRSRLVASGAEMPVSPVQSTAGSTAGSTGVSTRLPSPDSTASKRLGSVPENVENDSLFSWKSGATTLGESPGPDVTTLDKEHLTAPDGSFSDGRAESVTEIVLTDDEGPGDGVPSNCDEEEIDVPRQSDGAVEFSPVAESERDASPSNETNTGLGANPKVRSAREIPSQNLDVPVEERQVGDARIRTSDFDCADTTLDGPGSHGMANPVPPAADFQPLDSSLTAIPPDRIVEWHGSAGKDRTLFDDDSTESMDMFDGPLLGTLPNRSAPSHSKERSPQGLFLPDTSDIPCPSFAPAPSVLTSPPPSSSSTDRRHPPLSIDNPRQCLPNGDPPSGTDPTHIALTIPSTTSTSTATSSSDSSSEHDPSDDEDDDDEDDYDGDSDKSNDASTASHTNPTWEFSARNRIATPADNVYAKNILHWQNGCLPDEGFFRQDVAPTAAPFTTPATAPVTALSTRDSLYGLRDKLLQSSGSKVNLPTRSQVIANGLPVLDDHCGARLADCVCDTCKKLETLLGVMDRQASIPGSPQLCRARGFWLTEARWAWTSDLDARNLSAKTDSEVWLASHASFKRRTDEGFLLDKPVIIRGLQSDENEYDAKGLQRILLDRFRGCMVQVTDMLAQDPKTVALEDFLPDFWSDGQAVGCCSMPESLEADSPAFVKYTRFCLLRSAVARAQNGSEGNFDEVFDRIKAFTRVESAGFFCPPRVGTFGGTWMRVLTGELLCMFVPRAQTTTNMYGDLAREDLHWRPDGKQKVFLLKENEVLVLPPGIICAHVAVRPCVSLEGSFWDEMETGRYATATRLTPQCNPPRVADEIPLRAIECVLEGLATIVNNMEHRFESDFFYRGNGHFDLPTEATAEVISHHDITGLAGISSPHVDADRGAKRICQRSAERVVQDIHRTTLDEPMQCS